MFHRKRSTFQNVWVTSMFRYKMYLNFSTLSVLKSTSFPMERHIFIVYISSNLVYIWFASRHLRPNSGTNCTSIRTSMSWIIYFSASFFYNICSSSQLFFFNMSYFFYVLCHKMKCLKTFTSKYILHLFISS